jgi:membrane associated rhomboid family serine protease
MGQQTDARTYVEQGDALLLQLQPQAAADEYQLALLAAPDDARAHLGLAQANLALGSYGVVYIQCREVARLAPDGADTALASAILHVMDRRYEAALTDLDRVVRLDPGRAYAHALRGYCFRRMGNSFDAQTAESKAARLAGVRGLAQLFPPVEVLPAPPPTMAEGESPTPYTAPRPWDQRSAMDRRMVRLRFTLGGSAVVTRTLIAINVVVFVLCGLFSRNFFEPYQGIFVNSATQEFVRADNPIYSFGIQQGLYIAHHLPLQAYRFVTAMFLHESLIHIGFNMWALYIFGIDTERRFGSGRFAIIYFASGILAGVLQAAVDPVAPALGASGAIFGIFGAFGAYILLRRSEFGRAANAVISQWAFLIVINLVFSIAAPGIGLWDHIGGFVTGFVLGLVFVSLMNARERSYRRT